MKLLNRARALDGNNEYIISQSIKIVLEAFNKYADEKEKELENIEKIFDNKIDEIEDSGWYEYDDKKLCLDFIYELKSEILK